MLWLVPLVGAVAIILLPPGAGKLARWLGLTVSVAVLALSIGIGLGFKAGGPTYQFVESIAGYRHSAPDTPSVSTASHWSSCC